MKRTRPPGFLSLLPLLAATVCAPGCAKRAPSAGQAGGSRVERAGWTLDLSPAGAVASLRGPDAVDLVRGGAEASRVRVGVAPDDRTAGAPDDDALAVCDAPTRVERLADGFAFEYDPAPRVPLRVRDEIRLTCVGAGPAVARTVTLTPVAPPLAQDVVLVVGNPFALPSPGRRVFAPMQNGVGEEREASPDLAWEWLLNGGLPAGRGRGGRLALPFLSESAPGSPLRLTHVADPLFTTSFRLADPASGRGGAFACVYTGMKAPMTASESRTFWTVIQGGGPEQAMDAWYATALADVPPGPAWLHDVALQYFDYLSHGGRGWFEDINAFAKAIAPADRGKVALALHGWYDWLGRYAFDEKTGKLEDEWVAFPNAEAMKTKNFPTSESVKMSKADVHRRIAYGKERGFRVMLYFADGMYIGDGLKDIYTPDQVLVPGGWTGPDTTGNAFVLNSCHPRVRARTKAYLRALLAEYGKEVDGLVWDETFHVRVNAMGPPAMPGYASRAMMTLVRECTQEVSRFRPGLAMMASDDIGLNFDGKWIWNDVPPYAIMSHGCWQDSHCAPEAWSFGIFPNYRNVLWSVNWEAVKHFDYTKFGVEQYGTPVAVTNGWLDDKGFAGLTEAERREVLDLFERQKTRPQRLRWLTGPPPAFR